MIDLAKSGKADYPHGKGLGNICMDIPEKDQRAGFVEYLFASCNFGGVGVVGFKARSDTFHAADRLERIHGIYWLCCGDLGCEGGILFSLSLHLNLSFVRCQKLSSKIYLTRSKWLLTAPVVGSS